METIQFHTTIKNGKIEVPRRFWKRFNEQVRVILVAGEEHPRQDGIIDRLLAEPVKLVDFQPFSRDEAHAE
jgi:hypothetical protein